jgi:hypothetical protein
MGGRRLQGADRDGEIRTWAAAAAIPAPSPWRCPGAAEVEIYTDVPGVADADPRRVPDARDLAEIGVAAMLAMAEEGSKVVHPRAIRAALPTATPLRVLSTFDEGEGTLVHHRPPTGPSRPLALAHRGGLVLLRARGPGLEALDPELLPLGEGRYLAPDDHALALRMARLTAADNQVRRERGWATLSLVFSGPGGRVCAPGAECSWRRPIAAAGCCLRSRSTRPSRRFTRASSPASEPRRPAAFFFAQLAILACTPDRDGAIVRAKSKPGQSRQVPFPTTRRDRNGWQEEGR